MLAIRAIVGQSFANRFPELIPYRQYLTEIGLDVTIFAAILCPELLCPDRRDNVLSLYLSTAVGRFTYVAGKLIAALVPLLGLTLVPVLLLFLGNTFFADSAPRYLGDHSTDSCASSPRASCSPHSSACSGSPSRHSRAAARSPSAATRH